MSDIQQQLNYYRRLSDELGGQVLRLQKEQTRLSTDVRRYQAITDLVRRTYSLINHSTQNEDLGDRFLQVLLRTMWVDRAVLLRYDEKSNLFVHQQSLGFQDTKPSTLHIKEPLPSYLYINSLSKPDPLSKALTKFMGAPYILLSYNIHEKIALVIGNLSEDKRFRLAFEEKDREIVEGSLNLYIDIIKRKEAEAELIDSEEKYRSLVHSSSESIFICHDDVITFTNEAGIKLLGSRNKNDIIGRSLLEFFSPSDHDDLIEATLELLESNKESPLMEKQLCKLDGSVADIQMILTPFTFQKKQAIHIIALDISAHKRMEKELIRSQQLESLGLLAGGIAHDFNNLLSAIVGNIDLAKSDLDKNKKPYKILDNAIRASDQAQGLTQKLLTFSKGGTPVKKISSISEIVSSSVNFILSGSNVRCNYLLPSDIWAVDIDIVQMKQVVENLTINALQAMKDGGVITIQLENIGKESLKDLPLEGDMYVKLTVQDQGMGIPKTIINNIFDPYFSTKEKGSGLGLATTYSVIKNHGGLINVESKPSKGTTFHVYIPASTEKPSQDMEEDVGQKVGVQGKVLIMDDDFLVREMTSDILKSLEYEVESVKDGEEAIECYKKEKEAGRPFQVVIMDLTIPGGMGGKTAVKKLLEFDPEAKVIVSSGYSNDPVISNYKSYGFQEALSKPFNIKTLSNTISRLLDP